MYRAYHISTFNERVQTSQCLLAPSQEQSFTTMNCLKLEIILSIIWFASAQKYDCECVSYYLCQFGRINSNGMGIIDSRGQSDRQKCPNPVDVCCKKNEQIFSKDFGQNLENMCGGRNPDGVGTRIMGEADTETQFSEFPWMVSVYYKPRTAYQFSYKCGGSLIRPQVVLTAAHHIHVGNDYKIRAGEWDLQTKTIRNYEEKKIASTIVHESYSKRTLVNDIALLFLESPVTISSRINVICLPPQGVVISSNECLVTGWGKQQFENNGKYQHVLKKIELPTVNRVQCETKLKRTRLGQKFKLHRSFMCAGGEEGKDSCTGDGGGPLVCPIPEEEDRYQQVGIVAWGIGCGTKGIPGVYVDVAYFREWIDQNLRKHNF